MKFEERIQLLRKEKGLSQEELAERLGVSRQAVSKWEAGLSYPDVDNLVTLSNIFHVSIDSMLKLEDDGCAVEPAIASDHTEAVNEAMIDFLCRAKKKCYAGKGAETKPSRPNSHDLCYSEGEYTYIDTYLGGERFSGEEAVWKQGVPVWSMNYSGRLVGEGFSGNFLMEALHLVPKEAPYRGPMVHRNGDYSYHCIVNGDVSWYQGYEEIFLFDKKVYECYFHGGVVK